jgi:hypothetical protein
MRFSSIFFLFFISLAFATPPEEIAALWQQKILEENISPALIDFTCWATHEGILDQEEARLFLDNTMNSSNDYYLEGFSQEKRWPEELTISFSLDSPADLLILPSDQLPELYENLKMEYAHFYIFEQSYFLASKYSLESVQMNPYGLLSFAIRDGQHILGQAYTTPTQSLFFPEQAIPCSFIQPALLANQFSKEQFNLYEESLILCKDDSGEKGGSDKSESGKNSESRREVDTRLSGGMDSEGNSYVRGGGSYSTRDENGKGSSTGGSAEVRKDKDGKIETKVELNHKRFF